MLRCRFCRRWRWAGRHGVGLCAAPVAVTIGESLVDPWSCDDIPTVFLVAPDGSRHVAYVDWHTEAVTAEAARLADVYDVPLR